ncbi:hypothetical protein D9M72_528310 [compost metagenome]
MFRQHHNARCAGHQVHGAAHALDHLARNGPVGEVAGSGHLHSAQDGDLHVAAADHAEGGRGVEDAAAGEDRDGLLAGVDEVGVFLSLVGEGAHAEQAVLALQDHADAIGQVVGHQRGDANAEVDVVAVVQFFGRDRSHFIPGPSHDDSPEESRGGAQAGTDTASEVTAASARGRTVRCSMSLTLPLARTRRWTNTPGVMMWFGSSWPGSTITSASATVMAPAVATTGLKFRAV